MNSEHPGMLPVACILVRHSLITQCLLWWHGSGSVCRDWSNHGRKHQFHETGGWSRPERRWGLCISRISACYILIGISSVARVKVWHSSDSYFLVPVWVFLLWREHSDMRLREGNRLLSYFYQKENSTPVDAYTDSQNQKWLLKRRSSLTCWQDAIQFDADLVANSGRSLETLVSVGTTLGVSTRNKGLQVPELQKKCLLD